MPTRVTSVRSIDSVAGFGSSPAFSENPGSLFCDSIALPCIGRCSCGRHRSAIRAVQQRAGRSCHRPNVYESTRIRYTRTHKVSDSGETDIQPPLCMPYTSDSQESYKQNTENTLCLTDSGETDKQCRITTHSMSDSPESDIQTTVFTLQLSDSAESDTYGAHMAR